MFRKGTVLYLDVIFDETSLMVGYRDSKGREICQHREW